MVTLDSYLQAGLKDKHFQIATRLSNRVYVLALQPTVSLDQDIVTVYLSSRRNSQSFADKIKDISKRLQCEYVCRPSNGVKNPDRMFDKYEQTNRSVVPRDVLAAKLIADSIDEMYSIAEQIGKFYYPLEFKDRVFQPQNSGYRDLQFTIPIGSIFGELKIVHRRLDQFDTIEHKVYEITRSVKPPISRDTANFVKALIETSKKQYADIWTEILADESGGI